MKHTSVYILKRETPSMAKARESAREQVRQAYPNNDPKCVSLTQDETDWIVEFKLLPKENQDA